MVQIMIKKRQDVAEWCLIELQGELQSRYQTGLAGNDLGDLHFNDKGDPILVIGHHIMYGKKKLLDKPIAVLVKEAKESSLQSIESNTAVEYESVHRVHAFIKTKLMFLSRPKPIILHVPKKV